MEDVSKISIVDFDFQRFVNIETEIFFAESSGIVQVRAPFPWCARSCAATHRGTLGYTRALNMRLFYGAFWKERPHAWVGVGG